MSMVALVEMAWKRIFWNSIWKAIYGKTYLWLALLPTKVELVIRLSTIKTNFFFLEAVWCTIEELNTEKVLIAFIPYHWAIFVGLESRFRVIIFQLEDITKHVYIAENICWFMVALIQMNKFYRIWLYLI